MEKTRARNEALDLRVYNLAAFAIANINVKALAEKEAEVREKPPQKQNERIVPRQRNNFATSWR